MVQITFTLFLVVDGGFSDWTQWTSCSVTCGSGQAVRRKTCDRPAPQYGGRDCLGPADEVEQCSNGPCPGG